MGTYYKIKIYASKNPAFIFKSAFKKLKELEGKFSDYSSNSEVSRISNMAGQGYVRVSPECIDLIKKALKVSEESAGAFDITVRPMMEVWGFKEEKDFPPSGDKIRNTLKLIGYKKIHIDSDQIMLELKGMKLDLGGIAIGYAVDEISRLLRNSGIKNGVIEIGGDIYCLGKGIDSRGWRIGIQDPRHKNEIIAMLKISDKAIVTSGDYEKFFFWRGKRYPHIIDPRNGFPVQNSLISVTIISTCCTQADAWATALFVLGWEKAQKIIESDNDLEAVLIREGNLGLEIWVSSGLKEQIEVYGKHKVIFESSAISG